MVVNTPRESTTSPFYVCPSQLHGPMFKVNPKTILSQVC